MPVTLVEMKSAAPAIDRSTWLSAAKCTTASVPAIRSPTRAASRMSPSTNRSRGESSTGARLVSVPGVGEQVQDDDLGVGQRRVGAGQRRRTKFEPMNPAPPVTSMRMTAPSGVVGRGGRDGQGRRHCLVTRRRIFRCGRRGDDRPGPGRRTGPGLGRLRRGRLVVVVSVVLVSVVLVVGVGSTWVWSTWVWSTGSTTQARRLRPSP